MGRLSWLNSLVLLIGLIGIPQGGYAFTPTISPDGLPVRWVGDVKLNFAGNPKNRSGLSEKRF